MLFSVFSNHIIYHPLVVYYITIVNTNRGRDFTQQREGFYTMKGEILHNEGRDFTQ